MRILGALVALAAAATVAQGAPPLFLVDTPFDEPAASRLYTVDPATGVLALRSDAGNAYAPIFALAAADGQTLYAVGADNGGDFCPEGSRSGCLLLRIELGPTAADPPAVTAIGPVLAGGLVVPDIVGLTFRGDGRLYAISQETDGLYAIDPVTAEAAVVGTATVDLYGGDLTFDAEDRLWVWTNASAVQGLYEMDPATAECFLMDSEPGLSLSGLAAVGHTNTMHGSDAPADRLREVSPTAGVTGVSRALTLGGSSFDHKRGDLDSPFCESHAACDDQDACTTDRCTPGGCRNAHEDPTCDGADDDCDGEFDEDFPDRPTTCGIGACASTGSLRCDAGAEVDDCVPGTPAFDDSLCNGVDDDCDGLVDEDADLDGDGLADCVDNCPAIANPGQADLDLDGSGDLCDLCPVDPANDADGDGICADLDCAPDAYGSSALPGYASALRVGADRATLAWDGAEQGHVYHLFRSGTAPDSAFSTAFVCVAPSLTSRVASDPTLPAPGELLSYLVAAENGCGVGGLGASSAGPRPAPDSPCPSFAGSDVDQDGVEDRDDVCPESADPFQFDAERDFVGDACDLCPSILDFPQSDRDADGRGDACDSCPDDPTGDGDGDGVCDGIDTCPDVSNPEQVDADGDGVGDACDNCRHAANPDQTNSDGDARGDACDNCPFVTNPNQKDSDHDGIGDACDPTP